MSRSSRQSPFRKTLAALGSAAAPPTGPLPGQSGNASAKTPATSAPHLKPPTPGTPAGGSATMPGVPVSTRGPVASSPSAGANSGAMPAIAQPGQPNSNRHVSRPPTFAGMAGVADGGPMAFTPLKDDAVRKGKKFFGLHRGLFTTPSRSAAALVRNYYGHALGIVILGVLVAGGIFGVSELQSYWSSDAYTRAQERDTAVKNGQWDTLVVFARKYGKDAVAESAVKKALETAYTDQVEQAVTAAESALRDGNIDAHRNLKRKLDELAGTWKDITGTELPVTVQGRVDSRVALFERQAVSTVREQVQALALKAESKIAAGDVRGGLETWRQGKLHLKDFTQAVNISAEQVPAIDDDVRVGEAAVLRAIERALSAQLRSEKDSALAAATNSAGALAGFIAVRQSIDAQGREFGLTEASMRNLNRDADLYADQVAKAVSISYVERLEAAGAKATQDLAQPEIPIGVAVETWRAAADGLVREAESSGLVGMSLDRLRDMRAARESDVRIRAIKRAKEAGVEELRALLTVFGDDPKVAAEIGRLITDAYIRQGNFQDATQFGTGDLKLHTMFGQMLADFWVGRDLRTAEQRVGEFIEAAKKSESAGKPEFDALLTIAAAYQPVIALHAGHPALYQQNREAVKRAARLIPASGAPLFALQAFSVAYFRMLTGSFAGAAVLLEQVATVLPEGYPYEYLLSVARVKAGNSAVTDAILDRRPTLSDRDRNKLFVLRYATAVEKDGNVQDELALANVMELITTGQAETLIAELNAEAGLNLTADDVVFTLGAIEFFYHYQRSQGIAKMRQPQSEAHRQAVTALTRLVDIVYPANAANADPSRIAAALDALQSDVMKFGEAWPQMLAKALVHFQTGYNKTDANAARGPFSLAIQKFEQLAEKKPVLKPVCWNYMGLISWLQGAETRAAQYFRKAVTDSNGAFGEAHFWLGSLAQTSGDEATALAEFRAAAGVDKAVKTPFPQAWYRLAEIGETSAEREANHAQYVKWNTGADDIARREFPAPLAKVPTDPDGADANKPKQLPDAGPDPRSNPPGLPDGSRNGNPNGRSGDGPDGTGGLPDRPDREHPDFPGEDARRHPTPRKPAHENILGNHANQPAATFGNGWRQPFESESQ